MTTQEEVNKSLGKSPFSAFSIICHYNNDLQLLKPEDAQFYINKHKQHTRIQILSTFTGFTAAGLASAKLLPGAGFFRGVAIAWLAVAGGLAGKGLGETLSTGARNAKAEVIRRYPGWSYDPRVVSFFSTNSNGNGNGN